MAAGALATPSLGAREDEPISGSRHSHVEESSRFLDLARRRRTQWRTAWQLRVLDAKNVHARELEALGGMQRQEIDTFPRRHDAILARQRHTLEEVGDLIA